MLPLIGYADRLSARPGETIEFKVSSTSKRDFKAELVRIVCADPNPEGPGRQEEEVAAEFAGSYPSHVKTAPLGSYARVEQTGPVADIESFTVIATVWPTLPGTASHRSEQGLIARFDSGSGKGFALCLDAKGAACALIGKGRGEPARLSTEIGRASCRERVCYAV